MSLMDNVKETITKPIVTIIDNRIDDILKGAKIESSGEYMSIADIRNAPKEIADEDEVYSLIGQEYGLESMSEYLNTKGMSNYSLSFYKKYLNSNYLNMIFNSINDKVISSTTKFYIGEQEIPFDLSVIKNISDCILKFGACLLNYIDETIQVIEPYRYKKISDDEYYIFTRLEPKIENNMQMPQFEELHRKRENGKFIETVNNYYFKDISKTSNLANYKKYLSFAGESYYIDSFTLFEIDGNNFLKNAKQQFFLLDMIETIRAVELKLSQFKIDADSSYFENGKVFVNDYYRIVQRELDDFEKPLYEPYQPNIRVDEYIKTKEDIISNISIQMGLSTRSLGLTSVNDQVATIALLDEEKTAETLNNIKNNLEVKLNKYFEMLNNGISIYIPAYISQSMPFKVDIISKLSNSMSVSEKVNFLWNNWSEEELMKETCKVKYEQGILMTKEEEAFAVANGILNVGTFNS